MSPRRPVLAIVASVLLSLAWGSRAEAVVITATDSGWYTNNNNHTPANENYVAGRVPGGGPGEIFFRDFFVFDLTTVVTPVTSATLRLFNPLGGFVSPQANETYAVFDVSVSIVNLTNGTANAFGDLGGGTSFGSIVMSAADNGTIVEIVFNPAGVAAINGALGGLFAVGGAVTTLTGNDDQFVFGFTGSSSLRELELEQVPEPGTLLLLGTGLVGLRLRRRRS